MATNPVSLLNEFCTKNKTKFKEEYTHTGPSHDRTFICTIALEEPFQDYKGIGNGKKRKDAKANAAFDLLQQLDSHSDELVFLPSPPGREMSPSPSRSPFSSNPPTPTLTNAKGTIQEYCQQRGLELPKYKTVNKTGPAHETEFTVKCSVYKGSRLVGEKLGVARALKAAEVNAAVNVYEFLINENPSFETIEGLDVEESPDLGATPNPLLPPQTAGSVKSKLQELCQANSLLIPNYTLISKSGPTHSPKFTVKCSIKDSQGEIIEEEFGYGKRIIEAEIDAATKTLDKIEKLLETMEWSGGGSPQFTSKSSRYNASRIEQGESMGVIDPVEIDELVARVIQSNCEEPEYLFETTEPVDLKDNSTMQHLCMAYARAMPSIVARRCTDYNVSLMPVVGQGMGATREEAQRDALATLICNTIALGVAGSH